jgi:hypothetical protein
MGHDSYHVPRDILNRDEPLCPCPDYGHFLIKRIHQFPFPAN